MAEGRDDGSIAPRRSLGGPILPPPPPGMAEDARKAEERRAAAERAEQERQAAQAQKAELKARQKADQRAAQEAKQAAARSERAAEKQQPRKAPRRSADATLPQPGFGAQAAVPGQSGPVATDPSTSGRAPQRQEATQQGSTQQAPAQRSAKGKGRSRTRRAQLRLVQIDAWSVMKTSLLLSVALGIVLLVAVAIILAVLNAAGVWDSINSIVQQAVGGTSGNQFDIRQYVGTQRILGFTAVVAVVDVILITAIATLGAFLYNLSAVLLGGIEVTLAEDG